MRGRKPIPTNLKLLRGNPGKRALPKNEPKLDPVIPDCPDDFPKEIREEWDRITKVLGGARILTEADRSALIAYCLSYGWLMDAARKIKNTGSVTTTKEGGARINPYLNVATRSFDVMKFCLSEFGMTASSRSRMKVDPPADVDPLDEFLAKNRRK